MNNEEEVVTQTVEICPLGKGRRILAFLADFFLNFILTFVFFNAALMPLCNLAFGASSRETRSDDAARRQFDILYNNKVMLHESDGDIYYYTSNVESTLNAYLSYYSFNDDDSLAKHPKYGHNVDNEFLYHFYKDIRNKFDTYKSTIEKFNESHDYFVIESETISLKSDIKNEIRLSFFSPSDMSDNGKKALGYLQDFFINAYASLFSDIEKNDLTYTHEVEGETITESYLHYKSIVDDCEYMMQIQLIVAAVAAFVISSAILYILIPLLNKDNKTIAMILMHLERIGTNNLFFLRKSETFILAFYHLIFNLPLLLFMPMTYVDFSYIFNITPLMSMFMIGFLLWLVSFLLIMIGSYNQSLSDKLSRSVLISESDLDELFRAKGYNV